MSKLVIIPCTMFPEGVIKLSCYSQRIQLSLVTLLVGVGITIIIDLQLNVSSSIISIFAIMTTCVTQIMTNTIQKCFKVSSTQLLYQSCPYQTITLFITRPFLDVVLTKKNVFVFHCTPLISWWASLLMYDLVSINFNTFLVIGRTFAMTYQLLGHLKTCLILAFGYVLLNNLFSWRNVCGIFIALFGIKFYSCECILES
ncbi:hypothetical protein CY35_06G056500 [Sphagnum magellanicum]|nr:hypothetical protein CY35_06G056500 [Sphagnum magellanicum]